MADVKEETKKQLSGTVVQVVSLKLATEEYGVDISQV